LVREKATPIASDERFPRWPQPSFNGSLPSIEEQAMELCIVLAIAALASAGLVSGMRLRVPSGDCRTPANAR
jgi:hypothetical protein